MLPFKFRRRDFRYSRCYDSLGAPEMQLFGADVYDSGTRFDENLIGVDGELEKSRE